MMQTEALYQALLAAFTLQRADQDDDATMARAATDILSAFAGLIAPPVVSVEGIAMIADDTPRLILAELQAIRALIDRQARYAGALATSLLVVGSNSPVLKGEMQPSPSQGIALPAGSDSLLG